MNQSIYRLVILFFVLGALAARATAVSAHTPIGGGDNESIATATLITDPSKSWAVYAELHEGGEAQYYQFEASQGETIHLTLYTTTHAEDDGFIPSLILMGPSIPNQGFIPAYVEVLPNAGLTAVDGVRAEQATYEAFAPSAFVELVNFSLPAPANGLYYVAVHNADRGGNYGLAIGDRESFTLTDWLLMPLATMSVYAWERQNVFLIYGPLLLTMAFGLFFLLRRHRNGQRLDLIAWLSATAGFLFLATGITVFFQMILSVSQSAVDGFVVATLILAILPLLVGGFALRFALRHSGDWGLSSRLWLVAFAVAALLVWAGFVVGPAIAIIAALLPSQWANLVMPQLSTTKGK